MLRKEICNLSNKKLFQLPNKKKLRLFTLKKALWKCSSMMIMCILQRNNKMEVAILEIRILFTADLVAKWAYIISYHIDPQHHWHWREMSETRYYVLRYTCLWISWIQTTAISPFPIVWRSIRASIRSGITCLLIQEQQ